MTRRTDANAGGGKRLTLSSAVLLSCTDSNCKDRRFFPRTRLIDKFPISIRKRPFSSEIPNRLLKQDVRAENPNFLRESRSIGRSPSNGLKVSTSKQRILRLARPQIWE